MAKADQKADQAQDPGGQAAGAASAATPAPPAEQQAGQGPQSAPSESRRPAEETVTPSREGYVSSRPILLPGDGGEQVMELAIALERHGYSNAVARGEAPAILTDALMDQVRQFQAEHKLDPTKPERGGETSPHRTRLEGVVDPRTWAKLLGRAPRYDRAEV